MKKLARIPVAMLGVVLAVSCRPDAPETENPVSKANGEPAPPTLSEGAGEEPVLSIVPPSERNIMGTVTKSGSGISPMDVAIGAPRPAASAPTNPEMKGGGGDSEGTTTVQLPANLPPGLPLPDLSAFGGDLVLESVTVSEAAPGEGPIGPDGKVVDPNSIILGRGGEPLPEPDSQPSIGLAPAPKPPSSSGRKLDPSEAPPMPQPSPDGKKKEE